MPDKQTDDAARRAFWTERMDAAHDFMNAIRDYPVEECGERVVSVPAAAEDAGVEVVFSETKVAGAFDRMFFMRESAAADLTAAARDMNERGWVLKVEDLYRTRAIQHGLGRVASVFDKVLDRILWELGGAMPGPGFLFKRLTAVIATCPKIGTHMSASAVDLSVMDRDDGSEVDRGGLYIDISERTPMDTPFVSPEARANRQAIGALMARHGFAAYPFEFWHYSRGDAYDQHIRSTGRPGRYGPVDVDTTTGQVTPIASPNAPLHTDEELRLLIQESLARRGGNPVPN